VVEISRFKDETFLVCFWVAGEGGWPERVAKTLIVEALLVAIYLLEEKRMYICTFY
jgi:hypothetical protein